MKITKEIKDKYIEYVCVYRARSGFKEISQRKHYYGRNKNAIIMIKEKS